MIEEKEYDLYFSKKQKEHLELSHRWNGKDYRALYIIDSTGKKIYYTHRTEAGKKPNAKWDDFILVGRARMI
jgi:hypothetical protein